MTDTPAHAFAHLGTEMEHFDRNAEGRAEQVIQDRWRLFVIGIVTTALSLGVLAVAANSGLSRAERAYQEAKV